MRILHVHDCAGVGALLVKLLNDAGLDAELIVRESIDRFGIERFYMVRGARVRLLSDSPKKFVFRILNIARKFDVLHLHSLDKVVPILKIAYPGKRVILHYHGSDIRDAWHARRKYWSRADAILVSTPDLLSGAPEVATWLPNPVDTEHFKPLEEVTRAKDEVLYFRLPYEDLDRALERVRKLGLKPVVSDRNVEYSALPHLLNRYEYFADRYSIPSLSKTALEALACGLKVVRWDGRIIEGLPREHEPDNVFAKYLQLLSELECARSRQL